MKRKMNEHMFHHIKQKIDKLLPVDRKVQFVILEEKLLVSLSKYIKKTRPMQVKV